MLVNSQKNRAA